jgi:hypothetical protein
MLQVTVPIIQQLHEEVAYAEATISNSKPKSVPLPIQIGSTGLPLFGGTNAQSKRRKRQSGTDESFFRECSIQEVWNLIH